MKSTAPGIHPPTATRLQTLGAQIRSHRKALRISATVVAEAAGMSRITLHRIEKGAPSVTMGAYCNALEALGLVLRATTDTMPSTEHAHKGWIPARIALADYPQLRQLAWQVHGTDTLTPREALDIYERNARHIDSQTMGEDEQDLWQSLRLALDTPTHDV